MAEPTEQQPYRRVTVRQSVFAIAVMVIVVVVLMGIASAAFDLRSDLSLVVVATTFTAGGVWAHVLLSTYARR